MHHNHAINRFFLFTSASFWIGAALFFLPAPVDAATLSERLAGRILLQVEDKGKGWYIEPKTRERAYLGRPADAFRIMRELGVGITNADLDRLRTNKPFACGLVGKIFLQVQASGEAWYVYPPDCSAHYLGRPADAFSIMRGKGLGITNGDIAKIPTAEKYADSEQPAVTPAQAAAAEGQSASVKRQSPSTDQKTTGSLPSVEMTTLAGSYRCWSYNVSGGGGGNCRLFAPIVLNKDGTYAVSSEKGTFTVTGDVIVLSQSKLRGPGKLIGGTQIRFEYDYNNWHHTITYLKEGGTTSPSASGASEVPVQIILQYPAKDSALDGIVTVVLVPEGEDPATAVYKPMALAVWDGDRTVAGSFHKATNQVKTKAKYDVYADWGREMVKSGTLDLTTTTAGPVTKVIQTTISGSASSNSNSSSGSSEQQASSLPPHSTTPQKTFVAVTLILHYPTGSNLLHNVTRIGFVKQGEHYNQGYGNLAGYGAESQQITALVPYAQTGFIYDVYTDSYTAGSKKVGMVDLRGASANVTKIISVE